ncbi:MAG: uroporphyrinogen decarboxylase family protein [Clostridia bacterium]
MNSRERVLATFQRKQADRVPMWCGASPEFIEKSKKFFGVDTEEDVLVRFHDDFRRVYSRYQGPDEFNPILNAKKGININVFGVERHGYGYGQPVRHPLKDATLEEIEAYPWPDPAWVDVSHIREDALQWKGEYAIMCGEWSPFFHDTIDMLGMENMMILMYEEPEKVQAVITHLADYYYEATKRILAEASDVLDIFFCGNDLGSMTGPLLGENLFREFIAPHLKRLCDLAHSYGLFTQMHVCGSFRPLIPAMIECGLDAVQSLQPATRNMAPADLKADFGDQIILNGCLDSVNVLIEGDEALVREVTKNTVLTMKPNGGYILSPSHDYLLEMTPVENVIAMYDTGLLYGKYDA